MKRYLLKYLPSERIFGKVYIVDRDPIISSYKNAYITAGEPSKKGGVFTCNNYIAPPSIISRGSSEAPFICDNIYISKEKETVNLKSAIYAGYLFGHFGHFLLETLPRLASLNKLGDFTVIFHANERLNNVYKKSCQNYLLNILGVPFDRVIIADTALSVDTLFIPESSFDIRRKIHKSFFEFTKNIVQTCSVKDKKDIKKIYLSRSNLKENGFREICNEFEIEEIFSYYGFDIVYPEKLSFLQQVELFQEADIITGFSGSSFHNLLFCKEQKRVLYLIAEERLNANILMIDKIREDESIGFFVDSEKIIVNNRASFKVVNVEELKSFVGNILSDWL